MSASTAATPVASRPASARSAARYREGLGRPLSNALDDVSLASRIFGPADPLDHPEPLLRRVYAYVAYRLGHGPEAEDVVAATFERALRYRQTYRPERGDPMAWLVGIAKHCMNDALAARSRDEVELPATQAGSYAFEDASVERLALREAISRLGERDQELLALRYGADLTAKAIARLVGTKTNAVEVALHRALARLRSELEPERTDRPARAAAAPEAR